MHVGAPRRMKMAAVGGDAPTRNTRLDGQYARRRVGSAVGGRIFRRAKMSNMVRKLMLSALSVILSLFLLEGLVRIFNLAPGPSIEVWRNYKGHESGIITGQEFKYYFERNSLGLRDHREFAKKSSSHRVLFLGDSFVYGIGVSNHETCTVPQKLDNPVTERV